LSKTVSIGGVSGSPPEQVLADSRELDEVLRQKLSALEAAWSGLTIADQHRRTARLVAEIIAGFIRIHPFVNGNGRMSRLLWAVLLVRLGLPMQLLTLTRPPEPYGEAMGKAMCGDLSHCMALVLQGLRQR